MVQYTTKTENICRSYNLTETEVIFSFAIASGAAPDAYRIIFNQSNKVTIDQCSALAQSLLTSKPALKIIINRIKNHKKHTNFQQRRKRDNKPENRNRREKEERRNEFKTRDGLITKIIDSVSVTSGKDQVTGLTTLAKMLGYDKPEELNENEKRIYFLPWISNCRSCKLMQLYTDLLKQRETGAKI